MRIFPNAFTNLGLNLAGGAAWRNGKCARLSKNCPTKGLEFGDCLVSLGEKERVCVCECVCMCERERERKCVCARCVRV